MSRFVSRVLHLSFIGLIFVLGMLIGQMAEANEEIEVEPLKVAVIDTGFRNLKEYPVEVPVCESGHFDYSTGQSQVGFDIVGHGTGMAAIAAKAIGSVPDNSYCIMVFNVYTMGRGIHPRNVSRAIYKAVNEGAIAINLSLTGTNRYGYELKALKYAIKKGVAVFVAAGNDKKDLNTYCSAYPACYKRDIKELNVIGAINRYGDPATYSNRGYFVNWFPGTVMGVTGTSAATAYATGRYVRYQLYLRTNK